MSDEKRKMLAEVTESIVQRAQREKPKPLFAVDAKTTPKGARGRDSLAAQAKGQAKRAGRWRP